MKLTARIIFGTFILAVMALGAHRFSNQPADPNILTCREMTIEQAELVFNVQIQVPTIREIQRMVGAEEDGIVGIETLEKWGQKIGNQSAMRDFK